MSDVDDDSIKHVLHSLERLIALHVILPGRAIFIERYARKWKAINDALFYENLKAFLNDFQKTVVYSNNAKIRIQKSKIAIIEISLFRKVFDIAARAIPSTDLQKRQSEQPWLDVLFLSLAYTIWEDMPRISVSGGDNLSKVPYSDTSSYQNGMETLERLVDICLARKIRLSLPVVGYTISVLLILADRPPAWTLLAKLVQLDVNVLITNTGLSTSADILAQVCGRIEDSTVSNDVYPRILSDIILPVMRGYAKSRNIDGFIQVWQDGLQSAIRQRYSSQHEPWNSPTVPTALVWDDDDVFDEFKALVEIYAPPSLGQKLLVQVLRPLDDLSTKVGSTAVEISNLAITTAYLEAQSAQSGLLPFQDNQQMALFRAALSGLQRKSDFQAQRWRLWKFIRVLLQNQPAGNALDNLKQLLRSDRGLVSLKTLSLDTDNDSSLKKAAKYLEVLECFSILVEVAHFAAGFLPTLHEEMKYLANLVRGCADPENSSALYMGSTQWDGRCHSCADVPKLVTACVGRVLEKPSTLSLDGKTSTELVSSALIFLSQSSSVRAEQPLSLNALLGVLLNMEEVLNSPTLRDLISAHLIGSHSSAANINASSHFLLRDYPTQTLKKSQVKRLASSMLDALSDGDTVVGSNDINNQLATILHLDTHSHGSVIDAQDWPRWVRASEKAQRPPKVISSSIVVTTNIYLKILRRLWCQVFTLQNSPILSQICSWATDSIKSCEQLPYFKSPYLSLQTFFAQAFKSQDILGSHLSEKKVRKLRVKFMQMLKAGLQDILPNLCDGSLVEVRLILHALLDVHDPIRDRELLFGMPGIQEMIIGKQHDVRLHKSTLLARFELSIQSAYREISSSLTVELDNAEVKTMLEAIASAAGTIENCSTDYIGVFATLLNHTIRKLGPKTKGMVLEYFRSESSHRLSPMLGPIAIAVVTSQLDSPEMMQHPVLAKEVGAIARSFSNRCSLFKASILLSLDNCKYVLEFRPTVVNQSTLDGVLAAVCALTSSSNESFPEENNAMSPDASAIYARICEVVGVVLGRHRRRISDRYHLLVPAMSNLLRCLFWPGTSTLHGLSGRDAAHTINTFGKSLPGWLTSSEEALSPTSAEQLGRLLSSICNPTVSAARTSRKRKHNELNDETKIARQLAGQHLIYLVTEYARCSLDGQIDPSVKESLLPGLYSVMDAIDRDLMSALNASMDVSSRAIFKTLYDNWMAHGRWDKS
ncbi:uncharacterized protein A1O9_05245 [Exophiala aquamarina CBS 119918]|uniref:Nucleolar 27S pre-rRNA processing Urb2/Npa2 C-terminal domain-containing protein n=1 Tax=Exophiala aquamarina CBS 119918 TaxID=1182545 RepID=A0A072PDH4_9EURO|nr:uncharacterized protein A1O9_05245 [Exophiala aquamarina CBS 119918]KEF57328.1 hypothetical protein A1O9_05245 [Exophiala aquamarina CBS 119918]